MIKSLRKRHLQIWMALGILLPSGIVLAWLAIPNTVAVKLLNPAAVQLLPIVKLKKETRQYCINIRTNSENGEWQLEWKNKTALTFPSAIIYRTKGDAFEIKNAELIGRIEARGDYVFAMAPDSANRDRVHLVLYDFIHHQLIDSINIQP